MCRSPGVRAAALSGVVAVMLTIAACGGSEISRSAAPSVDATPSASASPAEAASDTAAPSPAPTEDLPDPPLAGQMVVARVTAVALNVRSGPTTSATRLKDVLGATLSLAAGDYVLVLTDPTWAEGNWWYLAGVPQDSGLYAAPIPVGWVAGGTLAEPWLEPDSSACPVVAVTTLAELPAVERVGCFGSTSLTFDARIAALPPDAGLGGSCDVEDAYPRWLMCDHINYNWVNADGGTTWELQLHFDPDTGVAPTGLADVGTTGRAVSVSGHFSDPAAADCVIDPDASSLVGRSQWLTCASRFVVESIGPP